MEIQQYLNSLGGREDQAAYFMETQAHTCALVVVVLCIPMTLTSFVLLVNYLTSLSFSFLKCKMRNHTSILQVWLYINKWYIKFLAQYLTHVHSQ